MRQYYVVKLYSITWYHRKCSSTALVKTANYPPATTWIMSDYMRSIIAFTNWKISNFQVLRFFVCVLIFLVWFDLVSFRLLCFWKSCFFFASSSLASNYTHRKKKCQDRMIWLVKLHQFFGYKRVQFLSIMVSIGII